MYGCRFISWTLRGEGKRRVTPAFRELLRLVRDALALGAEVFRPALVASLAMFLLPETIRAGAELGRSRLAHDFRTLTAFRVSALVVPVWVTLGEGPVALVDACHTRVLGCILDVESKRDRAIARGRAAKLK